MRPWTGDRRAAGDHHALLHGSLRPRSGDARKVTRVVEGPTDGALDHADPELVDVAVGDEA